MEWKNNAELFSRHTQIRISAPDYTGTMQGATSTQKLEERKEDGESSSILLSC
jgi:hypothetical protein